MRLAAVDLDQDGSVDLVAADVQKDALYWLRNLGQGTFAAPIRYGASGYPTVFGADDISGDGRPDLILVNYTGGSMSVLRSACLP
jgi:hypothetical protein